MNLLPKIKKARVDQIESIRSAPIVIPNDNMFAGLVQDDAWEKSVSPPVGDNKHFPMGCEWKRGLKGVADAARARMAQGGLDDEQRETLQGVAEVYEEMVAFARRHADAIDPADAAKADMRGNLLAIVAGPPQTFAQALQLYYLLWRIRSVRIHPVVSTATLGRFDQYFIEYYERDIANGTATREKTLALIEDFYYKLNLCNSGDTLMTLTVSGTDVDGKDLTNELSYLFLEASYNVAMTEPHVSVRLHKNTPQRLRQLVNKRLMLGHGQPTMYFDEAVIPELIAAGIPKEYAVNYGSNGCSEIILDGCGKIQFSQVEAVKALELTMYNGSQIKLPGDPIGHYWTHKAEAEYDVPDSMVGYRSGDPLIFDCYEDLEAAYLDQYNAQLDKQLMLLIKHRHDEMKNGVTHPLYNGSLKNTLEHGWDMLKGGLPPYGMTMFSGSLPTAADGLAAVKKVVFEDKAYTMLQVIDAMKANFEGYDELRAALLAAPKFGNDDDFVDLIAKRLAENFIARTMDYSRKVGITISPTLLGYLFLKESRITGATPDGRKWKDPIAEHFSPTPGRAVNGPTAILKSVAKTKVKSAFGSGEIQISLPPFNDYEKGLAVLNTLIQFAQTHDFNMLNIAIYDIEKFRAAQKDPANHADVIIRVFGYNARFIDLSDQLQEHVMARILQD